MQMKRMAGMIVLAMAAGTFAHAQTSNTVKDDLFEGVEVFAKGASDVTEVTMDPDSLGMVDGKDKTKARRTVLSFVRTYSYDKAGMYRIEDVDAFRNKLNTGDWHCSVHTRSLKNSESTDVCEKRRTDDLKETAIITVEPKSLTFIHTIRKKGQWDGESGLVGLGPMGATHMPMLAMLGPDMLPLDLPMNLDIDLGKIDFDAMQASVGASMQAHQMVNSAEMKKRMAEAEKSLKDAQKQMHEGGTKPE